MGVIPTFREVVTKSGFDIQELTVEQTDALWIEYDQWIWDRVQELRRSSDFPGSPGLLNQILAEEMIAAHLGIGWAEENIVRPKTGRYLAYESHQLYKALSLYRVQELARRLYQLQSFPWFDIVLDAVRTRELSGAAFELDVLWTLQIASPYVETRRESGVKGRDYDAFALMDDHLVPVEVKAKDDTTPWSAKTVINTVKNAARQLPRGEVGLLFLRVPTAWVGPALEEGFVDALAEGTRQTTRVGAIITAIDKPHLNTENRRPSHAISTISLPQNAQSTSGRFACGSSNCGMLR